MTCINPATLTDVYARLADPLSALYGELGISPDAPPDDDNEASSVVEAPRSFLPFTGAGSGQLALVGLTILAWGMALVAFSRRRKMLG